MKKYIPRDIEKVILSLVVEFPIVFISGPRKSGKTTTLKKLFKNKGYNFLSFEDPILRAEAEKDPKLFISQLGDKNIISEIQYLEDFFNYLKNELKKENYSKKYIFSATGLSDKIIKLRDTFPDKISVIELLPLNYKEKKYVHNGIINNSEEFFESAALRGSFTEVLLNCKKDISGWYSSYMQAFLEKEIRTIHNIDNIKYFSSFLKILASKCAQVINFSSLALETGVSVNTVKRWVKILEYNRMIFLLSPYNSASIRTTKVAKLYFIDIGLLCYLLGIKLKDQLFNSTISQSVFENLCIQETIKSLINNKNINFYYLRTHNGLEIDLLIENKKEEILHPVEIKFAKTIKKSFTANIERFKKLFSDLNIAKGRLTSLTSETLNLNEEVISHTLFDYFVWLKSF